MQASKRRSPIQLGQRIPPAVCRRWPGDAPGDRVSCGTGRRLLAGPNLRPPRIASVAAKSTLVPNVRIAGASTMPEHRHSRMTGRDWLASS